MKISELTTPTNRLFLLIVLVALLICAVPLFGHLGALPIRIWDESRLAINAYEMYYNQNYLVTYFEGEPDMWNTKPPLMIWLQVLFMKIIGINETALRLPSALAAFATSLLLLIFSNRFLKAPLFGLIAVCVLITSPGFVNVHASRTGDYDALLTFSLPQVHCVSSPSVKREKTSFCMGSF